MDKVITISREFGSGGRELGMNLAERLGLPFYDKELISLSAEESDLAEEAFLHYDEHLPVQQESLEQYHYSPFSTVYEVSMSDQIFLAQSRVIRKLAEQGPCIIVGRCADRVLENSINLFVYAKMENRINRMNTLETGVNPEVMEERIREIDKKRRDYYQYYTGCEWGKAQNYHLCLESSLVGVEGCLDAALAYLECLI
ncbi:cytidylate kinase-like family protein [Lacrimispora sp. BS-2]|uniref:Cytidylate kinase-like family protein n=1 Tax=Lacrimispora sp. BS-2 TaxID=3151850 RepID=A0AAU7PVP5_9FIRM